MKNPRILYALLVFSIIALGILSRRIAIVPLYVGDIVWATMMFFIIRFLFIAIDIKRVACISLVICYLVELSQLYQAEWINQIRHTLAGSLILGRGFLWTDMIAYAVGIIVGYLIELFLSKSF